MGDVEERFERFRTEIEQEGALLDERYGAKRDAIDAIVVEHGYSPEALGEVLAAAGAWGARAPGAFEDVAERLKDVITAARAAVDLDPPDRKEPS